MKNELKPFGKFTPWAMLEGYHKVLANVTSVPISLVRFKNSS